MQDEPVMCFMDEVFGNKLNKLPFRSEGCFCAKRQANTCGYSEHMGIYGHIGLLVNNGSDHISRFPADSGKFDQFIYRERHFSLKILYEHVRHADQVFGFVVGIGNAPDKGKYLVEMGFCQGAGTREMGKKRRGGLVNPFVGALGG